MKIYVLFIVLSVSTCSVACSKVQRACTWTLNPDIVCRTCDRDNRDRKLIELFDRDSNKLRMFIVTASEEFEIEHPYKQARSFSGDIRTNQVRFDNADENAIFINGEKLSITRISWKE